MDKKVVMSSKALFSLSELLNYLENKWSNKVKRDFIRKLDICINRISKFPESSPESKEIKGLYKCVVTKQTSFYYRIGSQEIEIVAFLDNRQNPNKTIK